MDMEKPEEALDPAQKEMLRKVRVFSMVAIGTLCLGIMAFLSVIVYRVMTPKDTPTKQEVSASLTSRLPHRLFPEGLRILHVVPFHDRVYVTLERPDGRHELLVLDANTLQSGPEDTAPAAAPAP